MYSADTSQFPTNLFSIYDEFLWSGISWEHIIPKSYDAVSVYENGVTKCPFYLPCKSQSKKYNKKLKINV